MNRRIAILASGTGSNAQYITQYFRENGGGEVVLILSNNAAALALRRASQLGVDSFVFNKEELVIGSVVLEKLNEYRVDLVVLAGFLLKVPRVLIQAFPNQIINVHPALLPKFGGKGMYGMNVHNAVIEAQEKESGITIHYVNENYDEGAIIFQARCKAGDSAENLAKRIHLLEQEHFSKIIAQLIQPV
jgi:phosphoribosylglycinamide formyltransferase-1